MGGKWGEEIRGGQRAVIKSAITIIVKAAPRRVPSCIGNTRGQKLTRLLGLRFYAQLIEKKIRDLCEEAPDLPDFSAFHPAFKDTEGMETEDGNMRKAFFMYVESHFLLVCCVC